MDNDIENARRLCEVFATGYVPTGQRTRQLGEIVEAVEKALHGEELLHWRVRRALTTVARVAECAAHAVEQTDGAYLAGKVAVFHAASQIPTQRELAPPRRPISDR